MATEGSGENPGGDPQGPRGAEAAVSGLIVVLADVRLIIHPHRRQPHTHRPRDPIPNTLHHGRLSPHTLGQTKMKISRFSKNHVSQNTREYIEGYLVGDIIPGERFPSQGTRRSVSVNVRMTDRIMAIILHRGTKPACCGFLFVECASEILLSVRQSVTPGWGWG